ncbi:putative ATP-grasp-modified RiPP [Actinomadura kijaniata]|uniref:putative ATP-grasp-modified RiPP n=1 Tax=Actinomadura kijaniata TaxID=46161 RepID=UPI000A024B97|nr:putative ATP-grasp-modified RiPP [Actinomadura kijaniata]
MYQNADRLPAAPPPANAPHVAPHVARPWGLRRMAPYPHTIDVGVIATQIDPVTQTGATSDGELIEAKHKKSNTGTETKTRTSSDGDQDEDHSQDADQD